MATTKVDRCDIKVTPMKVHTPKLSPKSLATVQISNMRHRGRFIKNPRYTTSRLTALELSRTDAGRVTPRSPGYSTSTLKAHGNYHVERCDIKVTPMNAHPKKLSSKS